MPRRLLQKGILIALAVATLAACGSESPGPTTDGDGSGPITSTPDGALAAALVDIDRPDEDREDDALRRPAEVLAFTGVRPGASVFEIEAGRGYYTEILSRLVGPEGSVVMQNPAAFDVFAGQAVAKRLADNRLPNVRLSKSNFDDLDTEDESVDIVTWFLGPHELYFTPRGVESLGDERGAYAEAFRILKPGAHFVVLDHAAKPGAPKSTGGETHRIDPAIVKDLAQAAGFELVDQSDILRNPDDDYDIGVFDPTVRRKTDRFLIKFRKPE